MAEDRNIYGDIDNKTDWQVGHFEKQSGARVFGVKVEYEQTRGGYIAPATPQYTVIPVPSTQ